MKKNLIYSLIFIAVFSGCNKKEVLPDYTTNFIGLYYEEKIENDGLGNASFSDISAQISKAGNNKLDATIINKYTNKKLSNGETIGSGTATFVIENIEIISEKSVKINDKGLTGSGELHGNVLSIQAGSQVFSLKKL